jgi:hypothetical protein
MAGYTGSAYLPGSTDVGEDAYERIERYLGSFPTYTSECLFIRSKQASLIPFTLKPAQVYVHRLLSEQRKREGRVRALILKSRQLGMSTQVAGRFFRRCHLTPQQRAGLLFGIYERFDRNLPSELRPHTRASQRGRHLVYDAAQGGLGSEIQVETAGDSAAGRGATIQMLHASELAFWPNAEEVWVAIMQAVPDDDSEVIVESTANGVGGLFYELWTQAEQGENDFIPIFLPWFLEREYVATIGVDEREDIENSSDPYEREAQDRGFAFDYDMVKLSAEQLAWRRRTIRNKLRGDLRAFRQEYPTTPREAFLVSGSCFFDEEALRSYEAHSSKESLRGDVFVAAGGVMLRPNERGYVKVWEQPRRDGRYVIFADPAHGKAVASARGSFGDPESERGGRDFSSAHVYELGRKRYVAALHGRMPPESLAEYLEGLGYYYSSPGRADEGNIRRPAFIGVESQGSGETVLRVLQVELRYPNLFYQREVNHRTNSVTTVLGWHTNVSTRPILLDEFAAAIRMHEVDLPDLDTIEECFTFVRGSDGKAKGMSGCHDDRVISAAGCLQMARYAPEVAKGIIEERMTSDSPTGLFVYN